MKSRMYGSVITLALLAGFGCQSEAVPPRSAQRNPRREFNIVDYGAAGDGKTLDTDAFRKAIEACAAAGGGRIIVPSGTWLTGPIHLMSNEDFHVSAGATVLFSRKFDDYPLMVTDFEGERTVRCTSPLSGENLHDVSITGSGVIDGQGEAWRPLKASKASAALWGKMVQSGGFVDEKTQTWWPSRAARDGVIAMAKMRPGPTPPTIESYRPYRDALRPPMVNLCNCHNLLLDGPTFRNSASWNVHLLYCDDVAVRHVTIFNPYYAQNGDGLDIDSSRNVTVSDSTINAGDDVICLKSGRDAEGRRIGRPTENVTITRCILGHGHGGIAIGSETSGGVRNVNVSHCIMQGTDDALRFKTRRGRGGVVQNIDISDIQMSGIKNACISFDMYYELKRPAPSKSIEHPGRIDPPVAKPLDVEQELPQPVGPGTPEFRDITIRNIVCTGANIGLQLRGLPEMPLEDVTLDHAQITARQGGALIDCRGIVLRDVHIESAAVPALQIQDVRNLTMERDDFLPGPLERQK